MNDLPISHVTVHPVFHNGPPLLTGEIKHLSQIGKVLVLATPTPPPCQEGIIFHLSTTMWSARLNSLRSCHRSLEFMLCTGDFSVGTSPLHPHFLLYCPLVIHQAKLTPNFKPHPSKASSFVMPFWLPQVTCARLLESTYSQVHLPSYPPPTFTSLLYCAFILYCIDFRHH